MLRRSNHCNTAKLSQTSRQLVAKIHVCRDPGHQTRLRHAVA